MKRSVVTLMLVLAFAASAAAQRPALLRGTVAIGGTAPRTRLVFTDTERREYRVEGPLVDELRAIGAGWQVEVVGRAGESSGPVPPALFVYQYRIIRVETPQGPRKPFVGRVMLDKDGPVLVGEDLKIYRLEGDLPGVRDGMKVGIVGRLTGYAGNRRLEVDFFHVLDVRERLP